MPPFPSIACRLGVPCTVMIAVLTNPLNLFYGPLLSASLALASEVPQQPLPQQNLPQQELPQQTLLQQVQDCVQQQSTPPKSLLKKDATPSNPADPAAEALDITEQCIFSVVMLNSNGSVRPDASDRMANLMRQTGTKMPRPKGLGQSTIPLQIQPGQSLFRIPVSIQNQRFLFLLDTGASNSVIDHQTARKLELKGKPASSHLMGYLVVGQQNRQTPMVYALPTLVLGRTRVSQLVGIGLSTQAPPFSSDGILGLDFLSQFDLVIRPKKQTLSLQRPSAPVSSGIPLKGKLGVMTTSTVYINSKGPYTFLLDTGAAVTTLSEDLGKRLRLSPKKTKEVQVMGLGGQVVARWAQLDSLSLQNYRLANRDVLVTSSPIFQTLGIDGVIGQDVLNQYDQHWRFGSPGPLGAPAQGSLELTPIGSAPSR
jgi:predicted aspartyl protease